MDAGQPSQQVAGGAETFMPPGFPPVLSPSVPYDERTFNLTQHTQSTEPPKLTEFGVGAGDPVKVALECATASGGIRFPFICAANSLLPGGRYLDFGPTYEQEFCNRSNLLDTLTRKWPGMNDVSLYPISATGGIFSDRVAVYLGPREDNYEYLDPIPDLPVILVPPVRKPIVKGNGSLYQFREDDSTMRSKICGALRICLHNNYDRVVIGDFGLGDGNHNPPQAVAEIWRDLLLFDPNLRGQFQYVVFAFPDPTQNTTELHRDAHEREVGAAHETRWHDTTARIGTSSTMVDLPIRTPAPTDVEIFESVFHIDEIKRVCEEAAGRFELINRQMLS
ncbi:hypothetical protein E4U17_002913 [Claviceps sp. LM77 group G4]|nr:hypothetical protein E4U17_002913 [Claviceps sp. LM77 group G4]KAG6069728.1 hypothetical protein E4U16_007472 [Claviceps sp. LM84 group G4]KAG6084549.1 hypothetical protein E4U33_003253 [Claviceps sp. LM78 group G4]